MHEYSGTNIISPRTTGTWYYNIKTYLTWVCESVDWIHTGKHRPFVNMVTNLVVPQHAKTRTS